VGDRQTERSEAGSLEDLYRLRYEPMVRLAVLLLGTEATAEEVVQDCFIRVGRRWDKVDHPVAYLRAAVVNACRSQRRRAGLERAHAHAAPEEVELEADEVWDALARLPYRQRAALILRFYEDLADREIAETLGCRPATVRSLVHRGLNQLREVLEP
jgi:RNA polymerase sigma-70 factor (sigma-E family)